MKRTGATPSKGICGEENAGVAPRPGDRRCGPVAAKVALALLIILPGLSIAGPPYLTDDPEPVDLDHWEIFVASLAQRTVGGWSGTAPHVDANYGVFTDMHLQASVPLAYDKPVVGPWHAGLGDIEFGLKWRFLHESEDRPQIAVFPAITLPTGDEKRGLGGGHTQVFLPVWAQKSVGDWSASGGGGYWINPGAGNRDYWFMGVNVRCQVAESLSLGGEVFHTTANTTAGSSSTGFNLGAVCDLSEHVHVMASAGRDFSGPDLLLGYVAMQLTL